MDTQVLVDNRIDEGQAVLAQLVSGGFEVTVAFWVKMSDDGAWHLYIASPAVNSDKVGIAYRTLYDALRKLPNTSLTLSEIKLVNANSPLSQHALALRDRHRGRFPIDIRAHRFGDLSIEQVYLYQRMEVDYLGFDEMKRSFPSSELYSLWITFEQIHIADLSPFMGKINNADFEGKPAETLCFAGPSGGSGKRLGKLVFIYRPEGWNKMYRAETKSWEEVVSVQTGQKPYEAIDFSPLAALKTEERPGDHNIENIKKQMQEGWHMTIPPDEIPIYSLPFNYPLSKEGKPQQTVDWDYIRKIFERGGVVTLHPPPGWKFPAQS